MARRVTAGFHIASLIGKHLRGQLTKAEKAELDAWLSTSEQNRQLFKDLCSESSLEDQLQQFGNTDSEAGWKKLQDKMVAKERKTKKLFYRKHWWQVAAAILILSLGISQLWQHEFHKRGKEPNLASAFGGDILPGTKKAELILSNGKIVRLDTGTDTLFADNGSSIKRTINGELVYSNGQTVNEGWNTINIPNGGEYMVELEDGTKVWLNSATTLRYPVRFTGNERKVELAKGEAYFEVAKNKEKPFIVVAELMQVQAVGTAFNVDSYANSDSTNLTTLTEGRIKVTTKNKTVFVEPGEQVKADLNMTTVSNGDVECAMAWKNGLFIFNATPLPVVMERLARWYDVKIEYDETFKENKFFTGEIKRNVPVSKLLQMMELTGIARFRIVNSAIRVSIF